MLCSRSRPAGCSTHANSLSALVLKLVRCFSTLAGSNGKGDINSFCGRDTLLATDAHLKNVSDLPMTWPTSLFRAILLGAIVRVDQDCVSDQYMLSAPLYRLRRMRRTRALRTKVTGMQATPVRSGKRARAKRRRRPGSKQSRPRERYCVCAAPSCKVRSASCARVCGVACFLRKGSMDTLRGACLLQLELVSLFGDKRGMLRSTSIKVWAPHLTYACVGRFCLSLCRSGERKRRVTSWRSRRRSCGKRRSATPRPFACK